PPHIPLTYNISLVSFFPHTNTFGQYGYHIPHALLAPLLHLFSLIYLYLLNTSYSIIILYSPHHSGPLSIQYLISSTSHRTFHKISIISEDIYNHTYVKLGVEF